MSELKNTVGLEVSRPVVGPNSRQMAADSCREFAADEEATELALRMACEDPTEREHLSAGVARARGRVKAAARELIRSMIALILATLARMLLNRRYRKVTDERGEIGRAERSALALEKLLSSFFVRRIVGCGRLLRWLGASSRTDDEENTIHSLKVAERSYRAGDGFGAGLGYAADLPVIRVFVGVRVGADGLPVWCLKRFVRDEAGAPREVHSGSAEDADRAMLYFYMEPSHQTLAGLLATAAQEIEEVRQPTQEAA